MKSPEFSSAEDPILTSENPTIRFFIRQLGPEKTQNLSEFGDELSETSFKTFSEVENPEDFFADYMSEFLASQPASTVDSIREYSGYNYKFVNSVLRGFWNYDELGQKTPEKEKRFQNTAAEISTAIESSPRLPESIITFRGTNLDSFRGYGVDSLADLKSLEGQLFYESGFTSSSLNKDRSFFAKESDDSYDKHRDIEIEYLVPSGSRDGIPLLSDQLSYSKNQQEFLFDKGSLFKIISVDSSDSSAHIKMALLPKELWNQ